MTVTVWVGNDPQEWPTTDPRIQAYNALSTAANRIARNNAAGYLSQSTNKYRGMKFMGGYRISETHREVIEAMPKVLAGTITPEDAFGIIHSYDGMKERGL